MFVALVLGRSVVSHLFCAPWKGSAAQQLRILAGLFAGFLSSMPEFDFSAPSVLRLASAFTLATVNRLSS